VSARAHWLLQDGERVLAYGAGEVELNAHMHLERSGFTGYALLTTERAAASAPLLAERAATVAFAAPGPVIDVAAAVRAQVGGRPLVALGGGRVIDAAKAIGARERASRPEGVAAIPTTLSGAELTPIHRQLPGTDGGSIRPSLAICDPGLMASQPMPELAASAMNALAHACEACWNANGNPLSDAIAARGARRLCDGLEPDAPDREQLALGAVEAGHAFGLVGTGVHHIVCQTIVRALSTPHAATNAVILPHALALVARRAPTALAGLEHAFEGGSERAIRAAASRAVHARLREFGPSLDEYVALVPAMLERPDLSRTPGPRVSAQELVALIEAAW
jgi:maleylacetate reductase